MKEKDSWLSYDWKKIFNNFISGYFNQDTDNIYESLDEYLMKSSDENKIKVLNNLKIFLNYKEMSNEEKEQFIEDETMINYKAYGLTGLDWVKYIKTKLKEELKNLKEEE